MPIAALPQNTVRAIGSTSVISDPCSIVKELLDNSLDAGATAVFIEISQNTVDVIQAKDNGHGITSEDHPMVCKRAYTSKISTVEDLRGLGGRSLGFRGEALASAVEVSAGVTITTRTANEPVGSILKYGRNGELASTQRSSHPVGTTVRIIDLFKHIPVRRQTVLKGTTKTLTRIKKTIQSYAIAQPTIRLSLKVLKASNEKVNWVYAPRNDAKLMDAALKVAGTEVASACISRQWPCNKNSDDVPGVPNEPVLKVIALLANPEADVAKVNNGGQFFSVDGRPLASSRGIAKEMTKLYKSYLRAAASRNDHLVNISDPFLCLHIRCNEACYDVNVEPAKDDVLFEDQKEILSLVEDLFRDVYDEIPGGPEKRNTCAKGKERMANNDAFNLLLAHKEPVMSSAESVNNNHKSPNMISASSLFHMRSRQKDGVNQQRASAGEGSPRLSGISRSRDLEGLNPWSVTRLYTLSGASSHRNPHETSAIRGQLSHAVQGFDSGSSVIALHPNSAASSSPSAPTPNSRATNSPTDSRSSGSVSNPTQTSPITPLRTPSNYPRASRERDRERYGNGALDTWFQKTTQTSLREEPIEQQPANDAEEVPLSQLAQERFAANEILRKNSPGTVLASPTLILANKSPESIPSYQVSAPSRNRTSGTVPRRLDQWSAQLHQQPNANHNPELERALDFENRKREAMLKFREQRKNTRDTSSNSPHLSRYLAAKAALNPKSTNTPEQSIQDSGNSMSQSSLNPHDPRAYLIRHLASLHNPQEAKKTRRLNTSKLPLEKIPDGYDLHDACLVQPVDLSLITETVQELSTRGLYTWNEDRFAGFTASDKVHVDSWIGQIGVLLKERYRRSPGSEIPIININLSDLQ